MNRSTCYHCHSSPPNRHSVFCDACLRGNDRPLYFPKTRERSSALTRVLYLGAVVTTTFAVLKLADWLHGR